MKTVSISVVAIFLTTATLACSPLYKGTYLDYQHAHRFIPCPSGGVSSPQQQAYVAITSSLADEDWVVEKAEPHKFHVTARNCSRSAFAGGDYLKRHSSECVSVRFMAMENGDVLAVVPKEFPFHRRMVSPTHIWMANMDRTYSELRCYSEEKLKERMASPTKP